MDVQLGTAGKSLPGPTGMLTDMLWSQVQQPPPQPTAASSSVKHASEVGKLGVATCRMSPCHGAMLAWGNPIGLANSQPVPFDHQWSVVNLIQTPPSNQFADAGLQMHVRSSRPTLSSHTSSANFSRLSFIAGALNRHSLMRIGLGALHEPGIIN